MSEMTVLPIKVTLIFPDNSEKIIYTGFYDLFVKELAGHQSIVRHVASGTKLLVTPITMEEKIKLVDEMHFDISMGQRGNVLEWNYGDWKEKQ